MKAHIYYIHNEQIARAIHVLFISDKSIDTVILWSINQEG